ncbi:MAG: sulfocyanin-like copper-binding protein [Dehalococcoidia bacterium]
MQLRSLGRVAGLLILGSALFVACAGGASEKSEGSKSTEGSKAATGAGGDVGVTLSEWAVKPASASTKAGKVSFKVTNSGTTPHEFKIVKTDTAQDKLEKANGIVDETKYKPLAMTKQLNGSQNEEVSAELTAGKYVLICNVTGHYDLGMHSGFTVN